MALTDIIQKILDDAHAAVKTKHENALKEAADIERNAKEEAGKIKERYQQEADQKGQEMERKIQALAKTERKNLFLNKKRALLEKVFNEAKKELAKMSEKELEEIFIKFLTQIEDKKGTIYPAKNHLEIIKKALKTTNKDYEIGEAMDFAGGFLFTGKDTEMDYSFDSIIEKNVRPQVELKIAQTLFS